VPVSPSTQSEKLRRGRGLGVARDVLLLPPALAYLIIERVFWYGARAALRAVAQAPGVLALQVRLQRLPVGVLLAMFLIPELLSHAGGLAASVLLLRGAWAQAGLVALFIKGTAMLMEVWVYQTCEDKLLSVRWFARAHRLVMRARDWAVQRARPLAAWAEHLMCDSRASVNRRFRAIKKLLAARLSLHKRH
jgi:hypothetical protein